MRAARWSARERGANRSVELAIRARDAGEIGLPPPTFVTLWELQEHDSVASVFEAQAARRIESILPRPQRVADGAVSLYPGDAGYEDEDLERPGARHRLVMRKPGWRSPPVRGPLRCRHLPATSRTR